MRASNAFLKAILLRLLPINDYFSGPHVTTVKCNRDYQPACAADKNATDCDINAVHQCKELMDIIKETDKFDVVLDFSGYEPKWIHDNCQVLKDKVGVYIYISTDSVYEVRQIEGIDGAKVSILWINLTKAS